MQKLVTFLYANNKKSEREIKETNSFLPLHQKE